MRVVMFYHSLVSDWNHGNAHFLRGVATELVSRGHDVSVYEPRQSWSLTNLLAEHGDSHLEAYRRAYPLLRGSRYDLTSLNLDRALDGAQLVLVHEWNDPELVWRIGRHREARDGYRLFFHDTHHRSVTAPEKMAAYDLRHYDGVLAFGESVRQQYLRHGWTRQAWTWHEAADTRVFRPLPGSNPERELVWIGNWGDEERGAELNEFLFVPVRTLGLRARVHGVRYPAKAVQRLHEAGIDYAGWAPNYCVPQIFSRHQFTVHVPRRPYAQSLRGIPTIRVFEALACGIPLVCAPWTDTENLFTPGKDYLVARDGHEMTEQLRTLHGDKPLRDALMSHGLQTIAARHTCAHRVDELMQISEDCHA